MPQRARGVKGGVEDSPPAVLAGGAGLAVGTLDSGLVDPAQPQGKKARIRHSDSEVAAAK